MYMFLNTIIKHIHFHMGEAPIEDEDDGFGTAQLRISTNVINVSFTHWDSHIYIVNTCETCTTWTTSDISQDKWYEVPLC